MTAARRPRYRVPLAGGGKLELGRRTVVMGILNVTPDSFSDGGAHVRIDDALDAARRMAKQGASLIDVGGESTRPGASPVDAETESRRVAPVIEALRRELPPEIHLSVDTMKAEVAARALDAGAALVNDVAGLRDPEMLPLLVARNAPAVLMHMRGSPRTMQRNTSYDEGLMRSLTGWFEDRLASATGAGLPDDRIIIDPGIGFGKSVEGNLAILRRLDDLAAIGLPILVGASRKSFIGSILDLTVEQRLEGSLAAAVLAAANGAHIIRAHDVRETVRAVRFVDAMLHESETETLGGRDESSSGT